MQTTSVGEMADLEVKTYPNGAVEFLLREPQAHASGASKASWLVMAAFATALALWYKQQRLSLSLLLALGCALLAALVHLNAQRAVVEGIPSGRLGSRVAPIGVGHSCDCCPDDNRIHARGAGLGGQTEQATPQWQLVHTGQTLCCVSCMHGSLI